MEIAKHQLKDIFEKSRCKESSSDPEHRSLETKDWFQCMATASSLKSIFGADIEAQEIYIHQPSAMLKKWIEGNRKLFFGDTKSLHHFYNNVKGEKIDLTYKQVELRGEISKGKIRSINEKRQEFILGLNRDMAYQIHVLTNKVKLNLTQILFISTQELEKYLQSKKIQLID